MMQDNEWALTCIDGVDCALIQGAFSAWIGTILRPLRGRRGPTPLQQLLMAARLRNATVLDDGHLRCRLDGGEPVGDGDHLPARVVSVLPDE